MGRHALWLAQRGWKVKLIDVSEVGIEAARKKRGQPERWSAAALGCDERFDQRPKWWT